MTATFLLCGLENRVFTQREMSQNIIKEACGGKKKASILRMSGEVPSTS